MPKFKFSRLAVLIFSLFVPIYILVTFWRIDYTLEWLPGDWETSNFIIVVVNYITPILFCVGWGYFMLAVGTRISDSIDVMVETSQVISPHYVLFYGVNAMAILIVFLIPFVTTIVAALSFASMVFTMLTSRVDWDDLDEQARKFVKRVTIICAIPVLLCSALVFYESLIYSIELLKLFWENWVDPMFIFVKALGVGLSIGNFIILYKNAIGEMEGKKTRGSFQEYFNIYLIDAAIIAFIIFLEVMQIPLVNFIYYLSIPFILFTFVADYLHSKKMQEVTSFKDAVVENPIGHVLWLIFMVMSFLFEQYPGVKIVFVLLAVLIFAGAFFYAFSHLEELKEEE
jgi:hypothetical protein